MSTVVPPVEPRTAPEVRVDLIDKLRVNLPEWSLIDTATGKPDQASAALIEIAARFAQIVTERLNQAPDKHFLAFLDLLGAARLPPEAARVPLTFTVTPNSATDAVVPAGTQVAAILGEGEKTPVIFETERELTSVTASLKTLIAVDAARDWIADHSALLTAPAANGVHVFRGERANEHILYIGYGSGLSFAQLAGLTLTFQMHADSAVATDARALQWEIWDGVNGIALSAADSTQALTVAGTVSFTNLSQVPEQTVHGIRSRWLRCRLLTSVSPGTSPAQGMVRAMQLPMLSDIRVSASLNLAALVPELAFANAQAVDVSRAFLPFGDKPAIGDVFYLGQSEALGQPGGAITLDIALVNPVPENPPPNTPPSADLRLRWETWSGSAWVLLGESTPTGAIPGTSLVDGTKAFTKSSALTFALPSTLAPTTVNGVTSNWVRVQITAGNYGVEAGYVADDTQPGGFKLVLATFAPPLVRSLALSCTANTPQVVPDAVLAFNNAQFQDLRPALLAGRAAPFIGFDSHPPAFYAAFALPPSRTAFPNRTVSLYHGVRLPPYGERVTPLAPHLSAQTASPGVTVQHSFTLTNASAAPVTCELATRGGAWASAVAPAQVTLLPGLATEIKVFVTVPAVQEPSASDCGFLHLHLSSGPALHSVAFETRVGEVIPPRRELRFEYWNGSAWTPLAVSDGTDRLTRPGIVEFLGPRDFPESEHFGVRGYWVRALLEAGDDRPVQLSTLLPNTVFATHAVTVRHEVLGSSDASANLLLRTTRAPVLAHPELEVREGDTWVRWMEVADFHGSGVLDRHYVLDHISGQVTFGNGVQGRIPPRGVGNLRMARYRTGGGSTGNRASGTIAQLRTTVPYIEKVTNFEAATGGFAAESTAALLARAPRTLRHGGRAVAFEDYEDLACAASPEVARARAVPLRRLQDDPLSNSRVEGAVSVMIVPQSAEAKPLPSSGLMNRVADHLRKCATPTATLAVVGPLYVRVDVSLEIALASLRGATDIEATVHQRLRAFLHPLTGGRDGRGWDFGRRPHLSDVHAVVSEVPGVDHIRRLSINEIEEPAGALSTERFLVYSGRHQIALTFLGAE